MTLRTEVPGKSLAHFVLVLCLEDDCQPLPDQRSFQLIYWGNLNLNTNALDNDVLLQATHYEVNPEMSNYLRVGRHEQWLL